MKQSPREDISNDYRSSYQRYKALSTTFSTWLLSTYSNLLPSRGESHKASHKKNSKNPSNPSKSSVADLERIARTIVEAPHHGRHKVPKSILNCLYKVIQRRTEAHHYYRQRTDSDSDSNDSHAHFIGVLEKIFDILGGEEWLQEQLEARNKQKAQMEEWDRKLGENSPCPPSPPNRFLQFSPDMDDGLAVSDSEDEETDSWLPQTLSGGSKSGGRSKRRRSSATARQSRKRYNDAYPEMQFREDESDEMFMQFCFFDDLNMLRCQVKRIWLEWSRCPSLDGLVVASTATDVAVGIAERLEQRFIEHDPTNPHLSANAIHANLAAFDGFVRTSDDWTVNLMEPYFTILSGRKSRSNAGVASLPQLITLPGFDVGKKAGVDSSNSTVSPESRTRQDYWQTFMGRVAGELEVAHAHPILHRGDSAFTSLLRQSSDFNLPRNSIQLRVLDESSARLVEEVEEDIEPNHESQQPFTREDEAPIVRPCLLFGAQLYMDIEEVTRNVDFRYQDAITILGQKLYKYMDWLSCHNLRKHVDEFTGDPSKALISMREDITSMSERPLSASMSLLQRGVWQEGMGEFGRVVGLKISQDVGWEVKRGVVARFDPNRDRTLSPWTWGSRGMYLLTQSLKFGARAYNEGGMFITVAHIYNALRETQPCILEWKEMEEFLAIHGQDIFNGNRPTSSQADWQQDYFYNRWRLRMGLAISEFSRGKKSGQFAKKDKTWKTSQGCQLMNPEALGPMISFKRPKLGAARNVDGISKDLLAVKLVEKRMHMDSDSMKTVMVGRSKNSENLTNVVVATQDTLQNEMGKMSKNLFAMEARCQIVIESVLNAIPKDVLCDLLAQFGLAGQAEEAVDEQIRQNLPMFGALVLLCVWYSNPLCAVWMRQLDTAAQEPSDPDMVLLDEITSLDDLEPAHVEEVSTEES